jgi:hypothetical protein
MLTLGVLSFRRRTAYDAVARVMEGFPISRFMTQVHAPQL